EEGVDEPDPVRTGKQVEAEREWQTSLVTATMGPSHLDNGTYGPVLLDGDGVDPSIVFLRGDSLGCLAGERALRRASQPPLAGDPLAAAFERTDDVPAGGAELDGDRPSVHDNAATVFVDRDRVLPRHGLARRQGVLLGAGSCVGDGVRAPLESAVGPVAERPCLERHRGTVLGGQTESLFCRE